MLHLKKPIYLGLLILLTASCSNSEIDEPTSSLKPDKVEEFTAQKKLAKQMFSSVLTRLENGTVSAMLQRDGDKGKLQLALNHSEKTLHELCAAQENCVGGVYASVHNKGGKGEILHRVHKGKQMQSACAWLESYPSEFAPVDDTLKKEVIGRAWHWVKECFEEN
jgi:hypothetical protein